MSLLCLHLGSSAGGDYTFLFALTLDAVESAAGIVNDVLLQLNTAPVPNSKAISNLK